MLLVKPAGLGCVHFELDLGEDLLAFEGGQVKHLQKIVFTEVHFVWGAVFIRGGVGSGEACLALL